MAVDMFLKLDDIEGESREAKHRGEIEILSFSWGVSNSAKACGLGGGGGAGKVSVSDFSIVKRVDSATPQLMRHCVNGKHISSGLITVRKAGEKPVEYLKIKLEDILISSAQSGGGGASEPVEQVTLNFTRFEVTNLPSGETSSFDVCANEGTIGNH
jgi:type VI secretion system secreted protein Hcp